MVEKEAQRILRKQLNTSTKKRGKKLRKYTIFGICESRLIEKSRAC